MLPKTPDRTGEKEREREVRLKKTPKEEKERFLIPLPVEKPLPEGKTGQFGPLWTGVAKADRFPHSPFWATLNGPRDNTRTTRLGGSRR